MDASSSTKLDHLFPRDQNPEGPHNIIQEDSIERKEKFFPTGAIAFFVLLVILCLVIWFGIYFLMIERI